MSSGTARTTDWWHVFDDPVLNNLIQRAYAQNLTLREAGMKAAYAGTTTPEEVIRETIIEA